MSGLRSRKLPMVWVVGGAFVTLVGVAIALVLTLSIRANFYNTFSLLNDKAVLITNSLDHRLRANLDPAASTIGELQVLYGTGVIDITDPDRLSVALTGALAANSAITALIVTDLLQREISVYRDDDTGIEASGWLPVPIERLTQYQIADIAGVLVPTWGELVTTRDGVFTNVSVPLRQNGRVEAFLTAAISTDFLTRIVRELDTGPEMSNFIIGAGSQVLAFSDLERLQEETSADDLKLPMPVKRFADPVLRDFSEAPVLEQFDAALAEGVEVRFVEASDKEYILMSRSLSGYGPHDWTIGAYFERASLAGEVQRAMISARKSVV